MKFHEITIDDKPIVDAYTRIWKLNSSEYSFINLYMWGADSHIELCERDEVLYIMLNYGESLCMLPPLTFSRNADYEKAVKLASDYMGKPCFRGICNEFVAGFEDAGYTLLPDRDNYDYVYNTSDLITLEGKKYHGKRNHIHQFKSLYDYEYRRLDGSMLDECLDVYERWIAKKDENQFGLKEEMLAIERAIPHMEKLGIIGAGIYIDGKLEAFTLGERLNADMALIHIEKANGDITGLYPLINQSFIENEFSDTLLVNREEDMGIDGLRKAKLSYHPALFIEKYCI